MTIVFTAEGRFWRMKFLAATALASAIRSLAASTPTESVRPLMTILLADFARPNDAASRARASLDNVEPLNGNSIVIVSLRSRVVGVGVGTGLGSGSEARATGRIGSGGTVARVFGVRLGHAGSTHRPNLASDPKWSCTRRTTGFGCGVEVLVSRIACGACVQAAITAPAKTLCTSLKFIPKPSRAR